MQRIKGENSKRRSYANAYDADTYDILPLVMKPEGCSGERTCKIHQRCCEKKIGQHFNTSEDEPRIHLSQFAHKRTCSIVLAFLKTQAQHVLQLQRRIIRTNLRRYNIPIVYDALRLWN
mmetsp:Transcript_14899/g.19235  ORF Transcript_14899/g.19235 Transcript_14899/m.19235 type:complete len:119 (+) Transcript_14899:535-891(+)